MRSVARREDAPLPEPGFKPREPRLEGLSFRQLADVEAAAVGAPLRVAVAVVLVGREDGDRCRAVRRGGELALHQHAISRVRRLDGRAREGIGVRRRLDHQVLGESPDLGDVELRDVVEHDIPDGSAVLDRVELEEVDLALGQPHDVGVEKRPVREVVRALDAEVLAPV